MLRGVARNTLTNDKPSSEGTDFVTFGKKPLKVLGVAHILNVLSYPYLILRSLRTLSLKVVDAAEAKVRRYSSLMNAGNVPPSNIITDASRIVINSIFFLPEAVSFILQKTSVAVVDTVVSGLSKLFNFFVDKNNQGTNKSPSLEAERAVPSPTTSHNDTSSYNKIALDFSAQNSNDATSKKAEMPNTENKSSTLPTSTSVQVESNHNVNGLKPKSSETPDVDSKKSSLASGANPLKKPLPKPTFTQEYKAALAERKKLSVGLPDKQPEEVVQPKISG